MEITRYTVVLDAPDLDVESAFWAGVLGGRADADDVYDDWHTVRDSDGIVRLGIQLAPDHERPRWPDGTQQQLHLDLHVPDVRSAHEEVLALGAELLQAADDVDAASGFQVYADPAGHPFCLCWG